MFRSGRRLLGLRELSHRQFAELEPRLELLRSAWRVSPPLCAAVLVHIVVQAALPLALMIALGRVVGSVAAAFAVGSPRPDAGDDLLRAMVVLAAVVVLRPVSSELGTRVVLDELERRLDEHFRQRLMNVMLRPVGIAHLEDPAVLDQVALARRLSVSSASPGKALTGYSGLTAWRLSAVGAAVLLLVFRWWLGVGMVVASLFIRHFARKDVLRTAQVRMGNVRGVRRALYFRDLVLAPPAAKEVRIFGLGDWLRGRFADQWLSTMQEVWDERRESLRIRLGVALAVVASYGTAYVAVALAGVSGELTVAQLTTLLQAVTGVAGLGSFSGAADWAIEHGTAPLPGLLALERRIGGDGTDRGRSDVAVEPPRNVGAATTNPRIDQLPRHAIRFEGVAFRYDGSDRDVFTSLDLDIAAGRSLALVGANGVGKTTLVKLLSRLYEPTAGRITVDGVDLRELDPLAWRRRLAAIFQDFVRYELPVRDNVGFGAVGIRDADQELQAAVELAGIGSVLEGLPRGWETPLSTQYRDGVDLSGGQWQRVALARALFAVRGGAGVLILDEPTANLDVRAEAEIYQRFLDITRGLTTVVISHRFSTVRHADRICVLHSDRIAEDGTHDELMTRNGEYARLFRLQAARFSDDGDAGA